MRFCRRPGSRSLAGLGNVSTRPAVQEGRVASKVARPRRAGRPPSVRGARDGGRCSRRRDPLGERWKSSPRLTWRPPGEARWRMKDRRAKQTVECFSLREQVDRLVRECEAMTKWAADRGKTPAPWAVETTLQARFQLSSQSSSDVTKPQSSGPIGALRPDSGIEGSTLLSAHRHLSGLVHPARPQTIVRLEEERCVRSHLLLLFGPLPIVRWLVAAAVAFLAAFVLFASSDAVRSSASRHDTETTTTLLGMP
jgi:hypothetical protein